MKVITRIDSTENVSIVSFEKARGHIDFVCALFNELASAGINIDMISQTAPKGGCNAVSFTAFDTEISKVLTTVNKIKQKYPDIQPLVSTGNVKLSLFGHDMPQYSGIAAGVFSVLASIGIDTLLITTSEVDISIVVSSSDADKACEALKNKFLSE